MSVIPNASGIYRIRNIVNGKIYVGSAKSLSARKRQHWHELRSKKHSNRKLQRAWDKHGEHNFIFEIIESVIDVNSLIVSEQRWLDELKPLGDCGYNCSPLACSRLGAKTADESKKRMSAAHRGKKLTAHHRAALVARMTPQLKAKISASLKGRGPSKEHIARLHEINRGNKYCLGKKRDAAAVAKTAEANRGNKHSLGFKHTAQTLAKRRLARAGVPWTESRRAAFERWKASRAGA